MPKTSPAHPILLRHIDPTDRSIPVGWTLDETLNLGYGAPEGLVWYDGLDVDCLPGEDSSAPSICERLGIEYVHARLGWEHDASGMRRPIYGGIVLPLDDMPRLITALERVAAERMEMHLRRPTSWAQLADDSFEIDND